MAMAMTERRGYLLTWFFAAPHDSELQGLTNERVRFDTAPAVSVATAAKSPEKQACDCGGLSQLQCNRHLADRCSGDRTEQHKFDCQPLLRAIRARLLLLLPTSS